MGVYSKMTELNFSVLEDNMDLFDRRYSKLVDACIVHNLHCSLDNLGIRYEKWKGRDGNEHEITLTDYYLEYDEPEQQRYVYIGVMERVGDSNILNIDSYSQTNFIDSDEYDIGIPDEVYKVPLLCEHCHSGRKCKKTFLILDLVENMFFQVAQGCLTGYIYFELNRSIEEEFSLLNIEAERSEGTSSQNRDIVYYEYTDLVKHAFSHFMEQDEVKFIPRSEANYSQSLPRSERVLASVTSVNNRLESGVDFLDKVTDELVSDFTSEFLDSSDFDKRSLEVIVNENLIPSMKAGYVTYKVFRYLKPYKPKKREGDIYKDSKHLGVVGEKINLDVAYTREVSFSTDYGVSTMYFFETEDKDVIVWMTAKSLSVVRGEKLNLEGKVKKHNTYNGINQTFVSYTKLKSLDSN